MNLTTNVKIEIVILKSLLSNVVIKVNLEENLIMNHRKNLKEATIHVVNQYAVKNRHGDYVITVANTNLISKNHLCYTNVDTIIRQNECNIYRYLGIYLVSFYNCFSNRLS